MSALKSMTGFAVAHCQTEAGTVEIAIRSVNSRFLEISPSLSEGVPQISYECTKLVKTVAQRGKIEYSITLIPQTQPHLSLNEPLLDELIGKLQQISAKLHANAAAATVTANFNNTATFNGTATPVSIPVEIKGNDSGCSISVSDLSQINAMELLQYPRVLQACPIDQEQLKQHILELMAQAVTKFNASRSQEGEQLRTVLIHRLDAVTAQLQRVAPLLTSLVANERERIHLSALRLKWLFRLKRQILLRNTIVFAATSEACVLCCKRLCQHPPLSLWALQTIQSKHRGTLSLVND